MTGFGEIDQNVRFWAKMGYFWQFLPRKNAKMSLPYAYYAATLCKKPEQTYERILRYKMYVRTEANLKVPTASGGGPKIGKIYSIVWEK